MDIINYLLKLVILTIPLFAIPLMLKQSNSFMGRIGNIQGKLSGMTGGVSGWAKKNSGLSRMERNARMATRGYQRDDQGNIMRDKNGKPIEGDRYNTRRNRWGRFVGGYATRASTRSQFKESEAQRALESHATEDMLKNAKAYYGAGVDRKSGGANGAVDARVKLQVSKMALKRQVEDLEPLKLKGEIIGLRIKEMTNSDAYKKADTFGKADYLRGLAVAARDSGDFDSMKAASTALMQLGSPGVKVMQQLTNEMAGSGQAAQELAAHLGDQHYGDLEARRPEVLDFVESAGQGKYNESTPDMDRFSKVSGETLANLDPESIKGMAQAYEANGKGAQFTQIVQATLESPSAAKLTQAKLVALAESTGTNYLKQAQSNISKRQSQAVEEGVRNANK